MALPKDLYEQVNHYNNYRIDLGNINILSLSQIFVFEMSLGRLEGRGILNNFKRYSLDNYIKAIVSLFSGKSCKARNSKYLFVNDVFNNSMVQNMRAVQEEFEEGFIELIADKRLAGDNSVLIYRYFKPLVFVKQVFRVYGLLQKNATTFKKLCEEFKIKKRLLVLNIIDSLFVVNCASNFLKSHPDITDIVLNTDVHKLSKTLVLMSGEKNIHSYVIQHGATVLEYGYLPVIANYMLSWGKLSSDWFMERGTSPERLVAIGTPKMDDFVNYNKIEAELKEVRNILLVLNPIGDSHVRTLLQIISEAGIDKDYNLKIKLHPSSVDNRDLVEKVFKEPQVEILKEANTHDLIHQVDVVITTTSTVGNETIAFGKPLVQVKIADIENSMDYENRQCSHLIAQPEELKTLLRDKETLESKKINYPQFTSDFFYSLDGRSAERISKFITSKK